VSKNRRDHEDDAWRLCLKKYPRSVKVWLKYFEVLMGENKAAEARVLLERVIKSLRAEASPKQWKLQERFAVLEFRSGNMEHGRTLFDGLLQSRPKQFDIWCVYADMETKYGDADRAREVYDRIAHLEWPPERMRTALKKWIQFETKNGNDPGRKAYIKQIALEYQGQRGTN
jgi:rRNA biogenesis protein RRP5